MHPQGPFGRELVHRARRLPRSAAAEVLPTDAGRECDCQRLFIKCEEVIKDAGGRSWSSLYVRPATVAVTPRWPQGKPPSTGLRRARRRVRGRLYKSSSSRPIRTSREGQTYLLDRLSPLSHLPSTQASSGSAPARVTSSRSGLLFVSTRIRRRKLIFNAPCRCATRGRRSKRRNKRPGG